MRDLVALDQGPHSRGVGKVRRSVVEDDGRAQHQPARDEPGTHHPADVGRPKDHIACLQVEAVREILRGLHRETAVHVLRALRLTGRPRRVDDHERVFRGRVGDVEHRARVRDIGPRNIAPALGIRTPDAIDDDDRVDRWRPVGCRVRRLFHRDDLPAAVEAVGADEDLRPRIA